MWKETSNEVYAVIFAKHRKDLVVHSSYTDMTGNGYEWSNGHPDVVTEWGYRASEIPLIKIRQTKEHESDKEWNNEFYIHC